MKGFTTPSLAAVLLAGAASVLAVLPAQAQTAAQNTTEVESVVVTAQRRAERLEDVPMSIAALPAASLQRQGVQDFDNLTRATSGVRIARTGVFTQPSIRGVNTPTLGPGQENNIATYVDGFYQPDQLALSGDLIGVDNVQILKGPQGSLYGRNATGGAILINTLVPTHEFGGFAKVEYARYDDRRAQLFLNMPLGEKVTFNILGHYRHWDAYIRDVTGVYPGTGSRTDPPPYSGRTRNIGFVKDNGVRAKLKIDFTDDTRLTFGFRHRLFADNRATSFFMTDYPVLPRDPGVGFNIGGRDYVSLSVPNKNDVKVTEGNAKLEIGTPLGQLTSYTSYTRQKVGFNADYDGVKFDLVQSGRPFPRKTFQEAVDYNINAIENLDLVVGAHYFDDDGIGGTDVQLNGVLVSGLGSRLQTKSFAVFADGTYKLSDQLFLTAGARYSREKKQLDSVYDCCGLAGVRVTQPGGLKDTFHNFSPRVVLRYEMSPGTNVYASVSRGFKSGTFNSVGSDAVSIGKAVRPETITAYELGAKTAQHGFHLEAATYYYDYKNLQLPRLIISPTGVNQTLENAASAEIYGAEITGEWRGIEDLNLGASLSWNHARYKKFPNGAGTIPIGGFLTTVSQDYSGKRIPRAPDWTLNVNGDYTVHMGESRVVLAGSVFYSSQYTPTSASYAPATGKALFSQPGYAQGNVSVTWKSPGDRYELAAYLNNVTNKRYRIWYNPSTLGAWYVLSEPRMWGVRAGMNF